MINNIAMKRHKYKNKTEKVIYIYPQSKKEPQKETTQRN